MSGRKYKTSDRPGGATNRKAGIECEGLTVKALLLIGLAIQDDGRFGRFLRECTHP